MLILVSATLQAFAQETTSSPYSFFGLGLSNFKGTVENRTMGGIEVYSDSIHINLQNPAGLGDLKLVNFSVGAGHRGYNQKTNTASQEYTTTSVDYMALGLPMGKFAAAFGIFPLTSVGYRIENTTPGSVLRNMGTGGTNRVFIGFGYNIAKGLNAGVEANYNFGNIENTTLLFQDDLEYATREYNRSNLSGFAYNFGVTYRRMISENLEMHSSFSYTPKSNLKSVNERQIASVIQTSTGQSVVVEPLDLDIPDSEFTIPSKWTLGAGIGKPREWFVGAEYTAQQMSDYSHRPFNLPNVTYKSSSQYKLGGFYTPNFRSVSSYWNRVTYRAGMRYEQSGLNINGEDINEFGISFGAGLPMGRMFSNVNLGAEIGKRGTTNSGLVQENFFNVFISLSLNDRWFEKRLYD